MQIYNITKEKVTDLVNKSFDSKDIPEGLCLCKHCRLDVICYVLNRAKPVYVLSERGVAHLKDNYPNSLQEIADLSRLIENGIELVAKAKRTYHIEPDESEVEEAEAYYNFPAITGAVLAGDTFAPVDATIELTLDNKHVIMKDSKWFNPMSINKSNNEHYYFWPKALPAKEAGIERTFLFQIKVKTEEYEVTSHFLELSLISSKNLNDKFEIHNTHTCKNILLFKET